jgi:hypothetical protein
MMLMRLVNLARCYPPLSACRTSWLSQYSLQSHTLWGECTRAHFPTGARTERVFGARGCSSYGNHGYLYPPTTVLVKQVVLTNHKPVPYHALGAPEKLFLTRRSQIRGRRHEPDSFPNISQQDCKSERCLTLPYSFLHFLACLCAKLTSNLRSSSPLVAMNTSAKSTKNT